MSYPAAMAPAIGKQTHVRHQLALILLVTLLVAYIDRVNVSVLIVDGSFLKAMGIANDPVAKGSLMTTFLICYGLGNIIFSPIGDWLGPRKAMLISIVLWAAACIFGGLAGTFLVMISSRALLGFGESLHWPMQSKFVKNWFPANERGKANATWLVGLSLAPMIAMPLFTWMIPALGWRGNFFFLAALGVIPFILVWLFTADHPYLHRRINTAERDYVEAALKEEIEAEGKLAQASLWENMKVFIKDYRFWLVVIFYSGVTSIWWGTMAWLPSYLKNARGFNWAAMGALASLPYIICFFINIFSGHASDKAGRRAPFTMVGLLGASVCIYLGAYTESNLAAALLISAGIGSLAISTPAGWSLLQQIVPAKAVGAGAGMMNGIANGISGLAPVVIGFLIGATGSYTSGLLYLVGWGLVSAAACLILVLKGL
ncbi:MAG: MFS transporter [Syntrophobacteraceae bacterium]